METGDAASSERRVSGARKYDAGRPGVDRENPLPFSQRTYREIGGERGGGSV
jgi:hypothetical protein